MRIHEYIKEKIAALLKKRLLIPAAYLAVGLTQTHEPDCATKMVIANAILMCLFLIKPKIFISFDSVIMVLLLLWMVKGDNFGKKSMKEKCPNPTQNLFVDVSIWVFESFIYIFNFYMIFLGIAMIFQILREIVRSEFYQRSAPQVEEQNAGLSEEELSNLEVKTYTSLENPCNLKASKGSANDEELCSICISAYQTGEKIIIIPGCRHMFHENCIKDWLKTLAICPYCRRNLRSEEQPSNSIVQELDIESGFNSDYYANAENQQAYIALDEQKTTATSGAAYSVMNNQSCEMVTFNELPHRQLEISNQETISTHTDNK